MVKQTRVFYYITDEQNEEIAVRYAKSIFRTAPLYVLAGKLNSGETLVVLDFIYPIYPIVNVFEGNIYQTEGARVNSSIIFDRLIAAGFKLYYGKLANMIRNSRSGFKEFTKEGLIKELGLHEVTRQPRKLPSRKKVIS